MATPLRIKRRVSGAAGAPASLLSGELAWNMSSGIVYGGFGDNGSGVATSVKAMFGENFIKNVPAGGGTGQILGKASGTDGDFVWITPAEGGTEYTATGNGIELTGNQFSLNYPEIATGLGLAAGYAPISHTHSAADITSGVLDIARIPVLPSQKTITSSGNIAALTAPQQAEIGEGTVVTTTDGRRWVYSGSGSKTAEASYIELADITPEWSIIANKPSFATVATSGSYNDLSARPTLGTMAAQNAASVTITGGTIDNITMDGGTF